jgi:hypothetical protein
LPTGQHRHHRSVPQLPELVGHLGALPLLAFKNIADRLGHLLVERAVSAATMRAWPSASVSTASK